MRNIYVLIIMIIISSCGPDNKGAVNRGMKLPDFRVQLLDSSKVMNINDIVGNKEFVVFIFDPLCSYCHSELRSILQHEIDFKGLKIIMVTFSPYERMKAFNQEFNLGNRKEIILVRDTSFFLMKYFNLVSVPFTAIYNSEKKVVVTYDGIVKSDEILKRIRELNR